MGVAAEQGVLVRNDEVTAVVLASIRQVAPDADLTEIDPGEDLFELLELDSMDTLNIATVIEEQTGISIPERDYPKVRSLDQFIAYLTGAS
jgi:acyl carrier protein